MITCAVCGTPNNDLALKCSSCRSFLQSKIDALDLFQTLWQLIESPGAAFKRIVLATHKNYVILLGSLLGVAVVYAGLWYRSLGFQFSNVLTLAATGLVVGPPVGILLALLTSVLLTQSARIFRWHASFRNMFAVVAYASVPILYSLVFIFPLEIAIFGLDFFGQNPSPMVIKPVVYVMLLSFDAMGVVWSSFLLVVGVSVAAGTTRLNSLLLMGIVCAVVSGIALSLRLL
jgi:hypothetical protein